ncbi:MAG TPA: hypothetical protein VK416_03070 [Thermoanaerobaculia bacterium]|nr:hypothetical protein [Thermoanaerobaculia bacterium]
MALALVFLGMTRQDSGGPRTPITAPKGPHGFATQPGGYSSLQGGGGFVLFSFKDGRLRLLPPPGVLELISSVEFLLELPPPSAAFDEGAVAATAEIVLTRNPTLSRALTLAMSRTPPDAGVPLVAGELYLRIRKPAAIDGRRADIPPDSFAARAMRPVPYREFRSRRD